ncbi:MAG TPA: TolC family protein, partial [Planctomycetota bacterium]|nr:TolC family protein [Planctomycetota bacterium]
SGCAGPSSVPLPAEWSRVDARSAGVSSHARAWPGADPQATEPAELPEDATLDDLIRHAMQHNPELEAAFYRWRAATERVAQAKSLPDPQLGLAPVLDQVDRGSEYMGERYSISQMFPWFGKLSLRGDIAFENAEAEARRFEAARLELVDRVTRTWFEYAWLHEAAATARENLDLLIRLESVARSLFRTGMVSQADVNRAQVELGRLDDQVRSLDDMLGPAAAELNAALGRPAHARLPSAPPAPPSRQALRELPERDDQAWLVLARRDNPRLAALRHEVTREQESIALARKDYYPDIRLGLEYARDGSARMAMMDGGGTDMVMGMISLNLPIRRARYDAGVREAQARLGAATRSVRDQENRLDAELKGALFAYRDSARRMSLYGGTLVPKARQSMATTEAAYRAGASGFSDLIDAQRVLLEFQLAYERAAADRGKALARIRALVGAIDEGGSAEGHRSEEHYGAALRAPERSE